MKKPKFDIKKLFKKKKIDKKAILAFIQKNKVFVAVISAVLVSSVAAAVVLVQANSTYTISFVDYDGAIIQEQEVKRNEVPVFKGILDDYSDDEYVYSFFSWDKPLESAKKDTVYTAIYTTRPKEDVEDLEDEEDEDDEDDEDEESDEDDVEEFFITFLDRDGTILQKTKSKAGEMPSFVGKIDNITEDGFIYKFKSWSPALKKVEGAQTYTATYSKTAVTTGNKNTSTTEKEVVEKTVNNNARIAYVNAISKSTAVQEMAPSTIFYVDGNGYKFPIGDSLLTKKAPTAKGELSLLVNEYKPVVPNNVAFIGFVYNSSNNVFTAQYANVYQVNFVLGTNVADDQVKIEDQSVIDGNKVAAPAAPKPKIGMEFSGWYTSDDFKAENKWDFNKPVSGNMTLYAYWTKAIYVVNFIAGKCDNPQAGQTFYNEGVNEPKEELLKAKGYYFAGWYTSDKFLDTEKWDFDYDVVTTTPFYLYAKWEKEEYQVIFSSEYGSDPESVSVKYQEPVPVPNPLPEDSDHLLKGWYVGSEYSEENLWDFENDVVEDSMILYAYWVNACSVTFDMHGVGEQVESFKVEQHETIEVDKVPEPSQYGYKFKGWYIPSNIGADINFETDLEFIFGKSFIHYNTTLHALWEKEKYTVTFVSDYGTAPSSIEIPYLEKVPAVENPEDASHICTGWYQILDDGSKKEWDFSSDIVEKDITIYADWHEASTVSFDTHNHGGVTIDPIKLIKGNTIGSSNVPELSETGWDFNGWFPNENYIASEEWDLNNTKVNDKVITLHAYWTKKKYAVTFSTEWGNTPSKQDVEHGEKATIPTPEPKDDNHTFKAWYKGDTYSKANEWDFNTPIFEPVELKAYWVDTCTVTFNMHAVGEDKKPADLKVGKGDLIDLTKIEEPKVDYFRFMGWYKSDQFTEANKWKFDSDKVENTNTVLHAYWVDAPVKVTFIPQLDGVAAPEPYWSDKNAPIPADKLPTFDVHNYFEFVGWYKDQACTEANKWKADSKVGETNLDLYGKWQLVKHTVKFDMHGCGSQIADKHIEHGQKITDLESPTYTGYDFLGWYTSDTYEESSLWKKESNTVEKDLTLHAKWAIKQYNVSFMMNHASNKGVYTQTTAYHDHVIENVIKDPEIEGFDFLGWYLDKECTQDKAWNMATSVVKDHLELFAKWDVAKCDVIFDYQVPNVEKLTVPNQLYGSLISATTSMPTYAKHIFKGWYTNSSCSADSLWDFSKDKIQQKKLTLYAKWVDSVIVKLSIPSVVGKYGDSKTIDYAEVEVNTRINLPTERDYENWNSTKYELEGWYKSEQFTEENRWNVTEDLVSQDITLYGNYVELFDIKYYNGSQLLDSFKVRINTHLQPRTGPTVTNKVFAGWYTSSSFEVNTLWNFDNPITTDLNLYAKMDDGVYQVRFFNFDSLNILTVGVGADGIVAKPEMPEVNEKYFVGWFEDPEFTTPFDFETTRITEETNNRLIYCKWVIAFTVSFDYNGHPAGLISTKTAGQGFTVEPPEAPTADGYQFSGWYLKKNNDSNIFVDENKWDFEYDTVGNNITLVAYWLKKVDVTYNDETGTTKSISLTTNTVKIDQGDHGTFATNPLEVDVSNLNTLNLTDSSYLPTASNGYRFIGFKYNETTKTFVSQYATLYTIEVKSQDESMGSVEGGGSYIKGETATLYANPKTNYIFVKWTDGDRSNPREVNVSKSESYTAVFKYGVLPTKGDVIKLDDNRDYLVLNVTSSNVFVVSLKPIKNQNYWNSGSNKDNFVDSAGNTVQGIKYNGSNLDKYLNETFYEQLPAIMRNAILDANIKQYAYSYVDGHDDIADFDNEKITYKYEDEGIKNLSNKGSIDIGNRKVFALDINDLYNFYDTKTLNAETLNKFTDYIANEESLNIILRSSVAPDDKVMSISTSDSTFKTVDNTSSNATLPAFFIDLLADDVSYTKHPAYQVLGYCDDSSTGIVEGSGIFLEGYKATLTAHPKEGYLFKGWSDGVVDNPRKFNVTRTVELKAIFVKAPVKGNVIKLNDNKNYRVLSINGSEALVVSMDSVNNISFEGVNTNYFSSSLDTYLNQTWYNGLADNETTLPMKEAIKQVEISQNSYKKQNGLPINDDYAVSGTILNGNYYLTNPVSKAKDNRYVYALDIEDLINYFGKKGFSKVGLASLYNITGTITSTSCFRSVSDDGNSIWATLSADEYLDVVEANKSYQVRPAFVIDLCHKGVNFEKVNSAFTVEVVSSNEDMGTVEGGGPFDYVKEIEISANPKIGYKFVKWNDGSYDNPRTVVASCNVQYTAYFEEFIAPNKGDVITLNDGKDYYVLKMATPTNAYVVGLDNLESIKYSENGNYEDGPLDVYLNQTWYNSLNTGNTKPMHDAIVITGITEKQYRIYYDYNQISDPYKNTIYKYQRYNDDTVRAGYLVLDDAKYIGNRHVYQLSAEDLFEHFGYNNELSMNDMMSLFFNETQITSSSIWLRSSYSNANKQALISEYVSGDLTNEAIYYSPMNSNDKKYARASFIIDLSRNGVEFEVKEKKATVTLNTNDDERGKVVGGGTFLKGTKTTIFAIPNDGYEFAYWLVDGEADFFDSESTLNKKYTFTLQDDVTYTAYFSTPDEKYPLPNKGDVIELKDRNLYKVLKIEGSEAYVVRYNWNNTDRGRFSLDKVQLTSSYSNSYVKKYIETFIFNKIDNTDLKNAIKQVNVFENRFAHEVGLYTFEEGSNTIRFNSKSTSENEEVYIYPLSLNDIYEYICKDTIVSKDLVDMFGFVEEQKPDDKYWLRDSIDDTHAITLEYDSVSEKAKIGEQLVSDDTISILPAFVVDLNKLNGKYIIERNCQRYQITATAEDAKTGTVIGSGNYRENTPIILKAEPRQGYHFVKWNDGTTSNPRRVVANSDQSYIATFAPDMNSIKKGDIVKFNDNRNYRILKVEDGKALVVGQFVLPEKSAYNDTEVKPPVYIGSTLDKLLDETWYNTLQSQYPGLANAIVPNENLKYSAIAAGAGVGGIWVEIQSTIESAAGQAKKVYALDIADIYDYKGLDLTKEYYSDLDGLNEGIFVDDSVWLRTVQRSADYSNAISASISWYNSTTKRNVSPAFIVDLNNAGLVCNVVERSLPSTQEGGTPVLVSSLRKGNVIKLNDGKDYKILKINGSEALLFSLDAAGKSKYHTSSPAQYENGDDLYIKYEGSTLYQTYNSWYESLKNDPNTVAMHNAILAKNIIQNSYDFEDEPDSPNSFEDWITYKCQYSFKEDDYDNLLYASSIAVNNVHAFALDIKDIFDYYGERVLTSQEMNQLIANTTDAVGGTFYLRSSSAGKQVYIHSGENGYLKPYGYSESNDIHPTFYIDLSQDGIKCDVVSKDTYPNTYEISTNVNDDAWGSVNNGGVYKDGTNVTLTAKAKRGYLFSKWLINGEDAPEDKNSATITISVSKDETYTAVFDAIVPIFGYPKKGNIIKLDDGNLYRVIKSADNSPINNSILVMAIDDATSEFYGGIDSYYYINGHQTPYYFNATLDNYLNSWYNSSSDAIKQLIKQSTISQNYYDFSNSLDSYTYKVAGNTDTLLKNNGTSESQLRSVFVLDVKDIYDYFGSNSLTADELNSFFYYFEDEEIKPIHTRSSSDSNNSIVYNGNTGTFEKNPSAIKASVRPAFYYFLNNLQCEIYDSSTYDETYTVTVESNNKKMGTVKGSGVYKPNTVQTIEAIPYKGYEFDKWLKDGEPVSSLYNNPVKEIVVSNVNTVYTAVFKEKELPNGYTALEYLDFDGTYAIDTGLKLSDSYGFEFEFVPKSVVSKKQVYMGTKSGEFLFACNGSGNNDLQTYSLSINNFNIDISKTSGLSSVSKNVVTVLNKEVKIGDNKVQGYSTINSMAQAQNNNNIFIGSDISLANPSAMRLYSCKFYRSDALNAIRYLVPATRTSDNVSGLYDKANDTFYELQKIYKLTVNTNNAAFGRVEGSASFLKGATAKIKAIPYPGYNLYKWKINDNYDESEDRSKLERQITVNEDITYTAEFRSTSGFTSLEKGNIVKLNDDKNYRVLKVDGDKALVMALYDDDSLKDTFFMVGDPTKVVIGEKDYFKYVNGGIDTHLNTTWYDSLNNNIATKPLYSAIIKTEIYQSVYKKDSSTPDYSFNISNSNLRFIFDSKVSIGERYVYVIGIDEISEYLGKDSSSSSLVEMFKIDSSDHLYWLRDSVYDSAESLCIYKGAPSIITSSSIGVQQYLRPAFTIYLKATGLECDVVSDETYPETHLITIESNDNSKGSVNEGGYYLHGNEVTLTAKANDNSVFLKWDDGYTANPRTVIANEDHTYKAIFIDKNSDLPLPGDSIMLNDGRNYVVADIDEVGNALVVGQYFAGNSNFAQSSVLYNTSALHGFFNNWYLGEKNSSDENKAKVANAINKKSINISVYQKDSNDSNSLIITDSLKTADDVYVYPLDVLDIIKYRKLQSSTKKYSIADIFSRYDLFYGDSWLRSSEKNKGEALLSSGNGASVNTSFATNPAFEINLKADGITFTKKVMVIYLDEEGKVCKQFYDPSKSIKVVSGTRGTITYNSPISLADKKTVDLTNEYKVNAKENYVLIGYKYNSNDNSFTAQYKSNIQYTITTSAENGNITGGGTFYEDESTTLVATANAGYVFDKWIIDNEEDTTSDDKYNLTRTITVTKNASYKAVFKKLPEKSNIIRLNDNRSYLVLDMDGNNALVVARYDVEAPINYGNYMFDYSLVYNDLNKLPLPDQPNDTWYHSFSSDYPQLVEAIVPKQISYTEMKELETGSIEFKETKTVPQSATSQTSPFEYPAIYPLDLSDFAKYFNIDLQTVTLNISDQDFYNKYFNSEFFTGKHNTYLRSYIKNVGGNVNIVTSELSNPINIVDTPDMYVNPAFVIDLSKAGIRFELDKEVGVKFKDTNGRIKTIFFDDDTTITVSSGEFGKFPVEGDKSISLKSLTNNVDLTTGDYIITPNNGKELTGFELNLDTNTFKAQYKDSTKRTINVVAENGVVTKGNGVFELNDNVEIIVTPNEGYALDKWIIDNNEDTSDDKYNSTRTIKVTKNSTYKAIFKPLPEKSNIIKLNDNRNYLVISREGNEAYVVARYDVGPIKNNWITYTNSKLKDYISNTWFNSFATQYSILADAIKPKDINIETLGFNGDHFYMYNSLDIAGIKAYIVNIEDFAAYSGHEYNSAFLYPEVYLNALSESNFFTNKRSVFIRDCDYHNDKSIISKDFATVPKDSTYYANPAFVIDLTSNGVHFEKDKEVPVKYIDINGVSRTIYFDDDETITLIAGDDGKVGGESSKTITLKSYNEIDLNSNEYTATAKDGFEFKGITFDADNNKFNMLFMPIAAYDVTTEVEGNGSVTPGFKGFTGTSYSLVATPDTGYAFDKWIIDGQEDTSEDRYKSTRYISLTKDITYKAVFKPLPVKSDIITLNDNRNYLVISIDGNEAYVVARYDVGPIERGGIFFRKSYGYGAYLNNTWLNDLKTTSPVLESSIVEKDIVYRYFYKPVNNLATYNKDNVTGVKVRVVDMQELFKYLDLNQYTDIFSANYQTVINEVSNNNGFFTGKRNTYLINFEYTKGQYAFCSKDLGLVDINGSLHVNPAFVIDLTANGVHFEKDKEIPIKYKDSKGVNRTIYFDDDETITITAGSHGSFTTGLGDKTYQIHSLPDSGINLDIDTFKPAVADGYIFAGYEFDADNNTFVAQTFENCNIAVTAENGTVTKGNGIFPKTSNIEISVTPNEGFAFDKWIINGVVDESEDRYNSTRTITVSEDATYHAVFKPLPVKSNIIKLNDGRNYLVISMNGNEAYVVARYDVGPTIFCSSPKSFNTSSGVGKILNTDWLNELETINLALYNSIIPQNISFMYLYPYNQFDTFWRYNIKNIDNIKVYPLDLFKVLTYCGTNDLSDSEFKYEQVANYLSNSNIFTGKRQTYLINYTYGDDVPTSKDLMLLPYNAQAYTNPSFVIDLTKNGVHFELDNEVAVKYKDAKGIIRTIYFDDDEQISVYPGLYGNFGDKEKLDITLKNMGEIDITTAGYTPTVNEGKTFVGYEFDADSNSFIGIYDITITALTNNTTDTIMGTVLGDGVYNKGDEVVLTAKPNLGYVFYKWKVNGVYDTSVDFNKPTRTIIANADAEYTAEFVSISSLQKSDFISLADGRNYRILKMEGSKAFVLSMEDANNGSAIKYSKNNNFYTSDNVFKGSDGAYKEKNYYKYEKSDINIYLEGDFYNSLPDGMKTAIVATAIKQSAIKSFDKKFDRLIEGQHKIYVLDADDIKEYIGKNEFTKQELINMFFVDNNVQTEHNQWLRSFDSESSQSPNCISWDYFESEQDPFFNCSYSDSRYIRPAYVIDLNSANIQ